MPPTPLVLRDPARRPTCRAWHARWKIKREYGKKSDEMREANRCTAQDVARVLSARAGVVRSELYNRMPPRARDSQAAPIAQSAKQGFLAKQKLGSIGTKCRATMKEGGRWRTRATAPLGDLVQVHIS